MKAIVCGLAMLVAGGVPAQDLVVYDDDVRNGFIDDSYGGGSDFEHATTVRTGAASIAFTPNNFNAVAFTHPTQSFAQSQYVGARLWIHGGASGGQDLTVNVYAGTGGMAIAGGALASYVAGGAIGANEWRLAEIRFASAPISYAGSFMRFELQAAGAGAQPTAYIDDVALISTVRPDPIFLDGFEGDAPPPSPGTATIAVQQDVVVTGRTSDRYTWIDASGLPRSAALSHNNQAGGGGTLREYTYRVGAATRTAAVTDSQFSVGRNRGFG